jgi:hypothetical protein
MGVQTVARQGFYAARSHSYKLYMCFIKMKHKFTRLCVRLVIVMCAACENFHKNCPTLCQKKKKRYDTPGITSHRREIFTSTLYETPTFL